MSDAPPPPAPVSAPPAAGAPASGGAHRPLPARVVAFLSSFALAIVLLLVLLVLTFLGTLEQRHASLFDVQRRYFESVVLVHDFGPYTVLGLEIGPISIPLPGASVVLALLALNLVVGGVVRIRTRAATPGALVAHLGILLLLGGNLVEFLVSEKGQLTLHEPPRGRPDDTADAGSNEFRAYHEWEIVVLERREGRKATQYVLDAERLEDLDPDDVVTFTHARLPFAVEVTGWQRNAVPVPAPGEADAVGGWRLQGQKPRKEAELDRPGARVTLRLPEGAAPVPGLLWSAQAAPWVVAVGERRFELDLRTRRWTFPFRLVLRRFVHDAHTGTSMAREFWSYVTKVEDGVSRDVHVTMNEPFRHRGYTFYQSSWGPQDAGPGERLYSTFSVVRNPSDRIPLIACLVIAAGLLLHFGRKLVLHVMAQSRGRAPDGRTA